MLSNSNKRIYQIDLFRFIAALAVVFYHYLFRGTIVNNISLDFGKIGEYFKYGYLGVDLFFIISGFVIPLSIKHRSLTKFGISRITRLYPTYWLCVTLTFLTILFFGYPRFSVGLKQFFINLSMFQNYLGVKNIDGVYWTLFVEMKFYIFVIGFYLFLNRIRKIKFDFVIYIWLSLTILNLFLNNTLAFKILNFFLILDWSSYFIAGIILFQIYQTKASINYIVLLCLAMFISIFIATSKVDHLETLYGTSFSPFIIGSVIFLCYTLMFLASTDRLKVLNSPNLAKVGMLTYPLYLIHQFIGFILINALSNYINKFVLVALTISIMVFLSFLISEYYEPKISYKLKSKLIKLADNVKRKTV